MCHVSCVTCHLSHFMCHMSSVKWNVSHVMCHMSQVICHLSHVACRLSPVTCHLSLTPTATTRDPAPASSAIMHSRLVCKDPKFQKISKHKKLIETTKTQKLGMSILAISSSTRSLQSTGKRGFQMWTGYRRTLQPGLKD